jgi:DNA-directed RNA polymerase subunit L
MSLNVFRNLQYIPNDPARRFTFEIHNVDLSIINAFRRIIITEIPVIGFDGEEHPSLEVIENTGPLHNEYILQRFGCIPIFLNENDIDTYETDDYIYELNIKNDTNGTINVTTHDFTVTKQDKALSHNEVLSLFPVDNISKDPVLITRLRQGEHLHVKGKAVRRTARDHGGFTPALASFKFMQDPAIAMSSTNILDRERAFLKNEYGDPIAVLFEIETFSALTPKYLVLKAIEIIMNKLHMITQELFNPQSEKIKFTIKDNNGNFSFKDEDDTLGNFLQSLMHTHYIREKKLTSNNRYLSYVGYFCPHPLDRTMILRITFENTDEKASIPETEYIDVLKEHSNRTLIYLQEIQSSWSAQHKE